LLLGEGSLAADYVQSHTREVSDLMTKAVISVTEDASLQDVVEILEVHRIRRVPVLCNGMLVGLVSRQDLLRVVALGAKAAQAGESDDAIECRLRRELDAQPWIAASNIGISVENGVVRLDGAIFNERVRRALIIAAENAAPGMVVDDRLIWCDPDAALVSPG
jgi:CBS-domain-containing membrane protein